MFTLIVTIVDKGNSDWVIEAATSAGARGGTILSGTGASAKENLRMFDMHSDPEKDVVLVIVKNEIANTVFEKIYTDLGLDKPGRGIIFTLDISQSFGINKSEKNDN